MNKRTIFLILLAILLLPVSASAVTIVGLVVAAENTAFYIASGVVVILWIVTGILFLTATGAPEKLTLARKALFASVAGTLLVIIAGSAIALVGQAFGL